MPIYSDNPIFQGIQPLQIKAGSTDSLGNYVPASGELIYTTNTNKVYVGDGVKVGGYLVSGGGGGGNLDFGSIIVPAGFTLDLGAIA
jgi:hypothetical protein